jgi:hypothetical protein
MTHYGGTGHTPIGMLSSVDCELLYTTTTDAA